MITMCASWSITFKNLLNQAIHALIKKTTEHSFLHPIDIIVYISLRAVYSYDMQFNATYVKCKYINKRNKKNIAHLTVDTGVIAVIQTQIARKFRHFEYSIV
jgi:hypothetical protein